MTDNFPEDVEEEEVPASVESSQKQVRGRPFTKENAKTMQLSAARAKRQRKQARLEMLNAMVTKLNLGEELVKAVRDNDETKIGIVEKALRIVGLHHDQSQEAVAQKMEFKGDINKTGTETVKLVIEDYTKD